jgi:TPR repeat protein
MSAATKNIAAALYNDACLLASDPNSDKTEAARLYTLAAEQGYAPARHALGRCYATGSGVPQNEMAAVRHYRLAAEQGYADSQFELAERYRMGRTVQSDSVKAVAWYLEAARHGHEGANNALLAYSKGHDIPQNPKEAAQFYTLLANDEHALVLPWAQYKLAECYRTGKGVEQDSVEAVKWHLKAAKHQCNFADLAKDALINYSNGIGIPQNPHKAVELYALVAQEGYAWAQCKLAECYQTGTGVDMDPAQAKTLYLQAADQGYARAQHKLGRCFRSGIGTDRDHTKADQYLVLAAHNGCGEVDSKTVARVMGRSIASKLGYPNHSTAISKGIENAKSKKESLNFTTSPKHILALENAICERLRKCGANTPKRITAETTMAANAYIASVKPQKEGWISKTFKRVNDKSSSYAIR